MLKIKKWFDKVTSNGAWPFKKPTISKRDKITIVVGLITTAILLTTILFKLQPNSHADLWYALIFLLICVIWVSLATLTLSKWKQVKLRNLNPWGKWVAIFSMLILSLIITTYISLSIGWLLSMWFGGVDFLPTLSIPLNDKTGLFSDLARSLSITLSIGTDYDTLSYTGYWISVIVSIVFWYSQIIYVSVLAESLMDSAKE